MSITASVNHSLALGSAVRPDTPSGTLAVSVDRLVKSYGGRRVVDGLSFGVGAGECFAFLGPNGAGKTTTIELLEGYRVPDAGTARVLGLDPRRDAAALKPRIGLMLQEGGIYPAIRVREALRLFAAFYPRPADPLELLRLVGLTDAANTRYRQLSGGQKQRLSLALALVGRPDLVFLDEPTAGMDPQARLVTWEIVRSLKQRGVTVLLTTHFMDEAERLADRVAIVDQGRLIALGTPAALTQGRTAPTVRFSVAADLDCRALATLPSARTAREERPGWYAVETETVPPLLAELTAWLRDRNVLLTELRVGRESLEEVFLRLTGKDLRE